MNNAPSLLRILITTSLVCGSDVQYCVYIYKYVHVPNKYIHLQKYPCTAYSQELLKFYCLIVVNYAFQLVSTLSRAAQLISLVAHTRTHTHT